MKLLIDKDRQEMDNVKNVDKVDKMEKVDEVDKVDRVDMMDNVKHMDKVDNVKHVDKVDKDKTKKVDVSVSRRLVHQLGTALEQFPPWEENRVCF